MTNVTAIIVCMTDAERPFLAQAVESVRRQTCPCDIRLYVSADNTWIDGLAARWPDVAICKIPLARLGNVRNTGVRDSRTAWVAFLDGDDVWHPEKIERQLRAADEDGADMVGADHVLLNERGAECAYAVAKYIPMPSSWLVRRSVMMDFPFDNEAVPEDAPWWIAASPHIRRRRLPEFLLGYRVRGASLSSFSASKKRKVRLVTLGSAPLLRPWLMAASWLVNRLFRADHYCWRSEWGPGPRHESAARPAGH